MELIQPDFARHKRRVQTKGGLTTRPKDIERCPNNHPAWHLFHKKVGTETIICCRECEKTP